MPFSRADAASTALVAAAGAVAAAADDSWVVPAPRVDAVDTTGAGDATTGTLAAMLAERRPLAEALRVAVAAGALAVQARGTVDSYAPRDDVLAAASAGSAADPADPADPAGLRHRPHPEESTTA